MSAERLPFDEMLLKEKLKSEPTTWETRRELAQGLYDKQAYAEAAEIIWATDQIPNTDLDLAFAIRVLAKAQPRRAIRLLTAVLELNQGKSVQNMAMANALLHHGMVLQAARFYGAALEADPTLVNPDLEHFILWSDDESTMWGLFENKRTKLGELPWMVRDPKEALRLTSRVSLHTTPIYVPELPKVPGENLKHEIYQQEAKHNAKITPPPAVTIPIDRVDPKDRLYDETYGASVVASDPKPEPNAEAEEPKVAAQEVAPPAPVKLITPAAPAAPATLITPATPAAPIAAELPAAPAVVPAPVEPITAPAAVVAPVVTPEPPAPAVVLTPVAAPESPAPAVAATPAPAPEIPAPAAAVTPAAPSPVVSAFPAKVAFPEYTPPTSSVPVAITKETESVPATPQDSATSSVPETAKTSEPFPAVVKFPEITGPSTRVTISARTSPLESITSSVPASAPPTLPPSSFPAKVAFPEFNEPAAPAASAVPVTTPQASPFFADPTPSASVPAASATAFFADPTPSGPIPLPPIQEQKKAETPPPAESEDTIKKAPIPEAFPISQSAVPTTILRVKWSTAPARPGGPPATPPVAAPVAPPVAPAAAATIPFVAPAAQAPAAAPNATQPDASSGGVFMASGTATAAPADAPAGAPTPVLATPPAQTPVTPAAATSTPPPAPASGLRRLLFLPGRAVPPAGNPNDNQNP